MAEESGFVVDVVKPTGDHHADALHHDDIRGFESQLESTVKSTAALELSDDGGDFEDARAHDYEYNGTVDDPWQQQQVKEVSEDAPHDEFHSKEEDYGDELDEKKLNLDEEHRELVNDHELNNGFHNEGYEAHREEAEGEEHFREEVTTPVANAADNDEMSLETNYPIPYRSKLTEPFEPGQTLIVKGKTAEDSVRFTINLHTASADFSGNDVPLHISVRFDEGKIVFNTFSKGEWGKEERKSNPYKKGDPIDIRIRAHDQKYTIFADQKEIKEYEHRVPLSSVTHFSIDGDVFITHIHWGGKYYPVPYESGIPGEGIAPGKTLLIFGTPEKKGKRFHINLLKKNGDIALHFNPRFDEKAIVRNSLINNEWGNEEREGKVPLEKGVGFDLKVVNEEYAFQVFINEERFCTYAHRLEPHDLHGLQIGGDVEITGIQIF